MYNFFGRLGYQRGVFRGGNPNFFEQKLWRLVCKNACNAKRGRKARWKWDRSLTADAKGVGETMRLYIHMILCGSLYTLMYMLFDRILPYEFPLKWKRWLLRVNILFYLLPVPWLAAELRDVIKMLLETVVGITFPEVHDIKEIDTFNGTDLWKSMLVFNEEGKLIYSKRHKYFLFTFQIFLSKIILRW